MKKIRKLQIMGRVFKLSHKKLPRVDGRCCPVRETIELNPLAANRANTLLHELNHAIIFSGGLFEALDGNTKLIEIICEQFARVYDENFEFTQKK